MPQLDNEAGMAWNIFTRSKAKSLKIENDANDAANIVERSEFRGNVAMSISSKGGLKLPGGIIAKGGTAIAAIVIIYMSYYFYSYLTR
jgi:hypothetical protein